MKHTRYQIAILSMQAGGARQMALALFDRRRKMLKHGTTYPLKNGWTHEQIKEQIKAARHLAREYTQACHPSEHHQKRQIDASV